MISTSEFFKAAACGHLDKLQEGIDSFKNIDILDENSMTALGIAVEANQLDAVRMLLDAKASTSAEFKDNLTILNWAREQEDSDIARLIMLYNYLDRIYNTSVQWEKAKLTTGFCDICSVTMKEEESLDLTIDEVFESPKYANCLYDQSQMLEKARFASMNKEQILDYIKKQIKDHNHSDYYIVCESCVDRFFHKLVYGHFKEYIVTTVDEMFEQLEEN